MNKVMLIGNLGADAEIRHTQGGKIITKFNLATNTPYKNSSGEWCQRTEWHKCVIWKEWPGAKGDKIFLEGHISYSAWDDSTGVRRKETSIVANKIIPL